MPRALSPQSATAQPAETEITVARTGERLHEGQAELAVGGVHERVGAGLDLGGPGVEVVGPGAARRDHVAADLVWAAGSTAPIDSSQHRRARGARSSRPTMWPSYPMTPRTDEPGGAGPVGQPAGVLGSATATREADVDVDEDLGHPRPRRGVDRRVRVDGDRDARARCAPARRAGSRRPPRWPAGGRRRARRAPSPPSRAMVAQVKPGVARRRPGGAASAVHLCALTCGRSRSPGRASAMVRRLASSPAASTSSAGVVSSAVFMPGTLPTAPRGRRRGRAGTLRAVGTPWLGDACGLVDAFRAGELSPLEALDDCIAAMEASPLNAFSFTDFERARDGGAPGRRLAALRRRALRHQGAREGGGLAVHGGLR